MMMVLMMMMTIMMVTAMMNHFAPEGRARGFSLWCALGSGRLRWPARGSASGCLMMMMMMTLVTMIMMMILLLPSAMHCGNFARFSSFLNKGTITSSTKAQNCSDDETSKERPRLMNIITQWVWMNIAACHVVEQLQLCEVSGDWLLPTLDKVNSFVPDQGTQLSIKSTIVWLSKLLCSWSRSEVIFWVGQGVKLHLQKQRMLLKSISQSHIHLGILLCILCRSKLVPMYVISIQPACLRGVGQSVWIWSWPPMFWEIIRICGLSGNTKGNISLCLL